MHGDKLVIGGAQIAVSDPDRAGATRIVGAVPPPPGTPKARLVSLADGREYPVEDVPFVIGRDATSHLVVESDLVSRRHAEILRGPGGDSLLDLSGNGVWVNGRRITAPVLLREGDLVRIGETEFRYHLPEAGAAPAGAGYRLGDTIVGLQAVRRPPPMPEPAPAAAAEPLATLLVKRGQRKGERIPVRSPVVNIGRGEFNDIALPDASISANHVKLQLKEGIWVLTDLGSTNGSRVDGEAVQGDIALSPGVQITLGEVLLLFEPRDRGLKRVDTTAAIVQPSVPGAEATSRRTILILALAGVLLLAGFLLLR
jgi:pSer/pThr/pTyr-binding forkhead associated (FHA) protein